MTFEEIKRAFNGTWEPTTPDQMDGRWSVVAELDSEGWPVTLAYCCWDTDHWVANYENDGACGGQRSYGIIGFNPTHYLKVTPAKEEVNRSLIDEIIAAPKEDIERLAKVVSEITRNAMGT